MKFSKVELFISRANVLPCLRKFNRMLERNLRMPDGVTPGKGSWETLEEVLESMGAVFEKKTNGDIRITGFSSPLADARNIFRELDIIFKRLRGLINGDIITESGEELYVSPNGLGSRAEDAFGEAVECNGIVGHVFGEWPTEAMKYRHMPL